MDRNCNEQTSLLARKPFLYIHGDSFKTITGGHTAFFLWCEWQGLSGKKLAWRIASHAEMVSSLSHGGLDILMRSLLATLYVIWSGVTLLDNNGLVEKKKNSFHSCLKFRKVEGLELK